MRIFVAGASGVIGMRLVPRLVAEVCGPGTYHPGTLPPPPRIHVDDAARRTAELLDSPTSISTIAEESS